MSCNTTAGPFFVASAQEPSWNPLNIPGFTSLLTRSCEKAIGSSSAPFKCTMQFWWYLIYSLMSGMPSPTNSLGSVLNGMKAQNITNLRIFYNSNQTSVYRTLTVGTATPEGNTPAADHWFLSIGYTPIDGSEQILSIGFLANGSIDFTRTSQSELNQGTNLVQPLSSFIQTTTNSTVDIWRVLNALFVSYYWFVLADLGQSAPIMYPNSGQFLVPSKFSNPQMYQPSNNPFLYPNLTGTIFSDVAWNGSDKFSQVIKTVVSGNGSVESDPKIRRIYLCTVRQRKRFLILIVSVSGVGLSLIASFYSCGIMGLQKLTQCNEDEMRRRDDWIIPLRPTDTWKLTSVPYRHA